MSISLSLSLSDHYWLKNDWIFQNVIFHQTKKFKLKNSFVFVLRFPTNTQTHTGWLLLLLSGLFVIICRNYFVDSFVVWWSRIGFFSYLVWSDFLSFSPTLSCHSIVCGYRIISNKKEQHFVTNRASMIINEYAKHMYVSWMFSFFSLENINVFIIQIVLIIIIKKIGNILI